MALPVRRRTLGKSMSDFRDVDPRELRVPPSRAEGADPAKLARQISLFGRSTLGMPPPWVYEGTDGVLVLYNGVAAKDRRHAPMISDTQREALAVLAEVWALSPDVRLGQLLAHLGFLGEAHVGKGLGYIEDDELLAVLYRHRAELLARSQDAPNQSLQPTGAATSVSGSSMQTQAAPASER